MGESTVLTGRGSDHTTTVAGVAPSITPTVVRLSVAAGVLSAIAACVGLLWRGAGDPVTVTTIRGQSVELLGRGLYEHDTLFVAGNNLAGDLVTLLVALPLLVLALRRCRSGSMRGHLLLLGVLGYLLYYGANYALGAVAYNDLFVVYVAMFSAGLFAFVTAFAALDAGSPVLSARTPRRLVGGFMVLSGVVTVAVWLVEPIAALGTGGPPASLETHTTLFTHALDLGVVAPAAVTAGALILRRRALGYVIAMSLLVLEALLMPLITIGTITQIRLGLSFTPGEVVGPIASFTVLGALAIAVLRTILTNVEEPRPAAGRRDGPATSGRIAPVRARRKP